MNNRDFDNLFNNKLQGVNESDFAFNDAAWENVEDTLKKDGILLPKSRWRKFLPFFLVLGFVVSNGLLSWKYYSADKKTTLLGQKIEEGKSGSLTFLANPKYTPFLYTTKASITIVNKDFVPEKDHTTTLIKVADAYQSFSKLLSYYDEVKNDKKGIEEPVFRHSTAKIGENLYMGAFSYIGENVILGDNVKIYPNAYIAENCIIGDNVVVLAGAKVCSDSIIGNNCVIHNGAIIGHLTGRFSDRLQLRPDRPSNVDFYGYEVTPRIWHQFLVYTFYRWEVIMRESALLGILGLYTLGYFIDSAFESFRLDVALLLIVASAVLNVGIDSIGKILREYLHLPKYRITT